MSKEKESRVRALAQKNKDRLIQEFCPVFVFDKDEYIYPTSHEKFAENVLLAKKNHYDDLCKNARIVIGENQCADEIYSSLNSDQQKHITKDALEQYLLIKRHFFTDKGFTLSGFDNPEVKTYVQKENARKGKSLKAFGVEQLLHFNEKGKGYSLGSKVDIKGCEPINGKVSAPVDVTYQPVEDGVIISYQVLYPLSGAIPGLGILYNIMPNWLVKRANNFAVHPGDLEGVKIKVLIDDETGESKIDRLITYAHGVKGSRNLKADKLTYDKRGKPFIYVGRATHPSYSENFIGRNIFIDVVSHGAILEPTKFIDLTPTEIVNDRPIYNWEIVKRWGACISPRYKGWVRSNTEFESELSRRQVTSATYKPISESVIGKFFSAIYQKLLRLLGKADKNTPRVVILDKIEARKEPEISDSFVEKESNSPKAVLKQIVDDNPTSITDVGLFKEDNVIKKEKQDENYNPAKYK